MTSEEIKNKCKELYKQIKDAEGYLKDIREYCPHTNTITGNYSCRVGNIRLAKFCDDCEKVLKYLD